MANYVILVVLSCIIAFTSAAPSIGEHLVAVPAAVSHQARVDLPKTTIVEAVPVEPVVPIAKAATAVSHQSRVDIHHKPVIYEELISQPAVVAAEPATVVESARAALVPSNEILNKPLLKTAPFFAPAPLIETRTAYLEPANFALLPNEISHQSRYDEKSSGPLLTAPDGTLLKTPESSFSRYNTFTSTANAFTQQSRVDVNSPYVQTIYAAPAAYAYYF